MIGKGENEIHRVKVRDETNMRHLVSNSLQQRVELFPQ